MFFKFFDVFNCIDWMVEMFYKFIIVIVFVFVEVWNGIFQKFIYDNVSEYYDINICWYVIVLQICC